MKMKKKFKALKKLFCFLVVANCLTLGQKSTLAIPNPVKLAKQLINAQSVNNPETIKNAQQATPFTEEEIKNMVDESRIEQVLAQANFKADKPTLILGSGGGYGLEDPYHYPLKDENHNRKMNDFVYLLMYAVPKFLDKDINVIFVNGADKTISIPNKNKNDNIPTLLPDIPLNSKGKYDKYYSGSNQKDAMRLLCEKIAEKQNALVREWKPVLDEMDDPVLDKNTGEPLYRPVKVSYVNGMLANLSLQTNSNDAHNSEGLITYCHVNDVAGKLFSECIAHESKHSLTTKTVKTGNAEPVKTTDKKIITQLGDFGAPTSIDFVDYADNPRTQFKFFDEDAIERCAMSLAKGINKYFNIDINFANMNFEPVYNEQHKLKYVKLNLEIRGYDINNIKNCSIAILDADNKEQMANPEQFQKEIKFNESHSDDRLCATFKFKPFDNKEESTFSKNKHKKFYVKLYSQNKNNYQCVLVPSSVTNFEIGFKGDGSINIEPNAVYKNKKTH